MTEEKRQQGGNRKGVAPPGYYTARQATERLGLAPSTFRYYVSTGKIKKYVPPLKRDGYYAKREIDQLATELALFFHTHEEKKMIVTETRPARPEDAPGIVAVLESFGWQTATAEQRLAWYQVNPYIDYVAIHKETVLGYITAVPYRPSAMRDIMSGKRRAWDMKPADIYPYRQGQTYDLYIGIATRQDIPHSIIASSRLISGFLSFLEELADQGIRIRRLLAVSAEEDGQRLCRAIGFVQLPPEEGDLFPRFLLDLETSQSRFASLYREG